MFPDGPLHAAMSRAATLWEALLDRPHETSPAGRLRRARRRAAGASASSRAVRACRCSSTGRSSRRSSPAEMVRLRRAGYDTITLAAFIRFLRGEPVSLPPRPFLLTFDDGRARRLDEARRGPARARLRRRRCSSTSERRRGDPEYLSWQELDALQRGGRWDVQLESGIGQVPHALRPRARRRGPVLRLPRTEEVLGGWRERVFGDVSWGERQLAYRVPGYRPLAFSPPYGNYGQLATNDRAIPRLLLARLYETFTLVFTQDRPGLATTGAGTAGRSDASTWITRRSKA